MHINHRYILSKLQHISEIEPGFGNCKLRVLDYGCGAGEVVVGGLEIGLDIYGADIFYAGSTDKTQAMKSPCWGSRIQEMPSGRLGFEDSFFDVVVTNQVFEHVQDLASVLAEISRVLKEDGILLALFPSREVLREGHIGIPAIHWFPKGSRIRYYYAYALRGLGLGYFKEGKTIREWTTYGLDWLDTYTVYRAYSKIVSDFESQGFGIEHLECDYVRYRLAASGKQADWLTCWPFSSMVSFLFFRLAGLVILARKRKQ